MFARATRSAIEKNLDITFNMIASNL